MKVHSWHSLSVPDVAAQLEVTTNGLTREEAAKRLAEHGPNRVEHRGPPSALLLLVAQFKSPLILILLIAAIVSLLVGEMTDGYVILGVVIVNAVVGFIQERRAGQAMEQLRSLTPQEVHVIRDGDERLVPSEEVVPGDVVVLESGVVIPADGRLIEAVNLKINEAVFTGESVPAEKGSEPVPEPTGQPDQTDMAWRGTTVVNGRGRLLVTSTGMATRLGQIVRAVSHTGREETPFQQNLGSFAKKLTVAIIIFAAIVFVVGLFRDFAIQEIFLLSVSLIVSLIPEGLPVVITITLAFGMWQMAKRKALIRRLAAVESLGSVTIIAADKTGTLTHGQMMVEEVVTIGRTYRVSGEGYGLQGDYYLDDQPADPLEHPEVALALRVGVLCNDARFSTAADGQQQPIGDPTEIALLVAGAKAGLPARKLNETMPRVGEFPFDFALRYMVTFHRTDEAGKQFVAVKGAPRQILDLCGNISIDGKVQTMTDRHRREVRERYEQMASRALRGLAIAYAETKDDWRSLEAHELKGKLTYLGLAGLRDPIRTEARQTMETAQRAGIKLMMLTGDYRVTAAAVGQEVDLLEAGQHDALIDGEELATLSDDELAERLPTLRVASRVSPEQKLRIARALKARQEVVAMTGDGINDVPALSEANVGIAIGQGATDAAKEASDMVVTDGRLSSIVAAIAEGRNIYRNIQRVLMFLLASNFSELLLILVALFGGLPLPLLPTQIIWLNAITDPFMGIALAREPRKATILHEPPRPLRAPIISGQQWLRIFLLAAVIGLSALAVFLMEIRTDARREHVLAMTLTTIALGEWLSAFAFRARRTSLFRMFWTNALLWPTLVMVVAMHLAILYLPALAEVFHVAPLSLADWALVLAFGLPVLVVEEMRKAIVRWRNPHSA